MSSEHFQTGLLHSSRVGSQWASYNWISTLNTACILDKRSEEVEYEIRMNETLTNLAHQFRRFGERECVPASPLYSRLAVGMVDDATLLEIASAAHARPVPNLFFGAAQYLLLKGNSHPLAGFYPGLSDVPHDLHQQDPFPVFRAFCLHHAEQIRMLLVTRRVQTNEIRRCACLLPAFALVAQGGGPLALVEIGASAGLNLLWDRYRYHYGHQTWGDSASPVQLRCELRTQTSLPLPDGMPPIVYRIGLDLNPIDVHDEDATLWLRALIWPEQRDRAMYLQQAIALAQKETPPLLAGDAVSLLPDVLAEVPPEATLCLYHSFVLNQFPQAARERLDALLDAYATTRDFSVVSIEWEEPAPPVKLCRYVNGVRSEQVLGICDVHGAWLDWDPQQEKQ